MAVRLWRHPPPRRLLHKHLLPHRHPSLPRLHRHLRLPWQHLRLRLLRHQPRSAHQCRRCPRSLQERRCHRRNRLLRQHRYRLLPLPLPRPPRRRCRCNCIRGKLPGQVRADRLRSRSRELGRVADSRARLHSRTMSALDLNIRLRTGCRRSAWTRTALRTIWR